MAPLEGPSWVCQVMFYVDPYGSTGREPEGLKHYSLICQAEYFAFIWCSFLYNITDLNILRILLIDFYLTSITKDFKVCQIMVNNRKLS